ncbi:hypothetical protein ACIOHS_43665 [Streptomyces sp. NPDC088253]|uniref:hypothetical protein n=1 Tax=Streptomyces sp. NPDC088253 TaxID=3365846 RepID=UPI003800C0E8
MTLHDGYRLYSAIVAGFTAASGSGRFVARAYPGRTWPAGSVPALAKAGQLGPRRARLAYGRGPAR